jgi:molybdopterin-biosynthesis enzyme MoeA-like protein
MISISDDKIILDTFENFKTVDLVIVTGGLGPKDDVPKDVCDYFEDELVVNQKVLVMLPK